MRSLRRSSFLLLIAMSAGEAFACMPAFPDEELARAGHNVLIGTVESTSFVQRPPKAAVVGLSSTNNRSLAKPEMLVRVTLIELLQGKAPATVTAVSPCALPLPAGERVVVATYRGRRVAYPAGMYEEAFRNVHGLER